MAPDLVAKVVLAPLLIAQGLRVRRTAMSLPEALGPRTGHAGSGPALRLLILGDSSAAGVGVATQDEALSGHLAAALAARFTLNWRLLAQTGATTATTLRALDDAIGGFDVAVLALGVNDVTRGVPLGRWINGQTALWDRLSDQFGVTRIYVSGVPPLGDFPLLPHPLRWVLGRQATRYDAALQTALRARSDCTYVPLSPSLGPADMAEDGFHPGPRIYRDWGGKLAAMIAADLS